MIDMPIPVRAIEGDATGQARAGLSDAALMVLAQEVIVRLARWARDTTAERAAELPPVVPPDLEALCAALIGEDPTLPKQMILDAHARGASHEELCLWHIGEAARYLGEMWDEDRITFREMALAAGRMLHLLRDLRELAPPYAPRGEQCALFATVPGEKHVLGITMAADIFRKDGWDVDLRLDTTEVQLSDMLRRGGYPIVGLSAATPDRLRALARVVVELRLAAPKVLIFVGGNIARLEPDIAVRVGADGAAWEMHRCRQEMNRLHEMLPNVFGLN